MLNGSWSSSSASISWSNSTSTSPRRSGTLAIVRTPGPGGMRMQRSGAMTPRRAACARSKREVCVGKRSVTWRAMSAPVAVMPMKIGPGPRADRRRRLLAQRGVRLVADDDRVGVGDAPGVADEPLVGLDGDRAVGAVGAGAVEQRRRLAVAVAAVVQLAEELVDEVAAVGEDQDAAGARGLDEAHRGDGLAGAGRVLEPEALVGVGVVGRALVDVLVDVGLGVVLPDVLGLVVVLVLARRPRARRSSSSSSSSSSTASSSGSSSSSSSSSASSSGRSSSGSSGAAASGLGLGLVVDREHRLGGRRGERRGRSGRRPAARSACPRARRPGGG